MLFTVSAFAKSSLFLALLLAAAPAIAHQSESDGFDLRGVVLNAVTGEPVSRALVQLNALQAQPQLAGADGAFLFTNLPRGQYFLSAEKPGFLNAEQLGIWNAWMSSRQQIPAAGEVILKLTPEAIIYGTVKNQNGAPVEGVTVRAQRSQIVEGHRVFQNAGDAPTDDQGNFRIAELAPGSYRLWFIPISRGGWSISSTLSAKKESDVGYAAEFYPGVPDADSATSFQLSAGAQVQMDQALPQQKLFELAGVVRGIDPSTGFNLTLVNTSGDMMQRAVRIDRSSGSFQIPGIPAGTYLLSAIAQMTPGLAMAQSGPPLQAAQFIHLNSDLTGLVLTLGRTISLPVVVRDEVSQDQTGNPHRVTVQLFPKDFMQNMYETVTPVATDSQSPSAAIDNVLPGTYTVRATPNFPGYIASLRCGGLDLLREDLTVAQGASLRPIEVTLRTDSAQLNLTVVENGQPAPAQVVLYSETYPGRSILAQTTETGTASLTNLAPGDYQLIAFKDAHDLEFRNPLAMEKYLAYATSVTLQSSEQTSLRVEIQNLQGPQQ